jgi:hypothetical protein
LPEKANSAVNVMKEQRKTRTALAAEAVAILTDGRLRAAASRHVLVDTRLDLNMRIS